MDKKTTRAVAAGHPDFLIPGNGSSLETPIGAAVNSRYLASETALVPALADCGRLPPDRSEAIQRHAASLADAVRAASGSTSGFDAFMREYHLESPEGVALMCLAEALLRIPDAATADRLIRDKVPSGDWEAHLGDSQSLLVNASTWGLMLTGRLIETAGSERTALGQGLTRLVSRLSEPVVRAALRQAMRLLGSQFVMGRTIEEALERARGEAAAYRYSFDMLGEAALTSRDAQVYFEKYRAAILAIGKHAPESDDIATRPSISVKLSALHPRYELAQKDRVLKELAPKLLGLVELARECGIGLTVDAEEAERLELSLLLIASVLQNRVLDEYPGFGLAVQAYQRRAYPVLQWLIGVTRAQRLRVSVRLVKGAYWDTEIKRAQERGLASYPVFTRKANTDVSYLACARLLANARDVIYPQFATHNPHTVAYIAELFGDDPASFEYQRLHGMGEALYGQVRAAGGSSACRVYAPVGPHQELLPYLVRRLLENGANTSFVNRISNSRLPVEVLTRDPIAEASGTTPIAHPLIVDPPRLYGTERRNSLGLNLVDGADLRQLKSSCETAASAPFRAVPLINGKSVASEETQWIMNPADESLLVGTVEQASPADVERAVSGAEAAQPAWDALPAERRAEILERAADAFELHRGMFVARCTLEAGKTVPDALAEVREAADFLRYYAGQARTQFGPPRELVGPTGERNTLRLRGKGVFGCVSPWNFPLAIFSGQVAAALAAGNAVVAKPAEQTPFSAALAVQLLHEAGVPPSVLQFLPGRGETVGAALTADVRIAGIAFTGSNETARAIERSLAARRGSIATFIAETGGINAMIVDSSALPEQVVLDAVASGINSAGQRCSALRLLLLQEEIAPRVLELLVGHLEELHIGEPGLLSTDIGPVIDRDALASLEIYAARVTAGATWHHRMRLPPGTERGRFFAPLIVELPSVRSLEREVFGPIVHVVRYRAVELDQVVEAVNALGYGLTLGIHTRMESVAEKITAHARVGNVYVNRNMIGAVVGVQPFGGCGLSGTGPKAGGPHYLPRFANEQAVSTNTAAVGGNASLLASTQ
jgi:RHH-type proline utilization regulon transcriptional repressor/proline dehydrogenase/delta 1-pyrroline-5-carboxylate dehydrogenase